MLSGRNGGKNVMAGDGVPWARVPHGRWPPRKPRAGNAAWTTTSISYFSKLFPLNLPLVFIQDPG